MRGATLLKQGVRLVAASCLLTACEHPIAVVTPHAEVADLVFSDSASAVVFMRTTDNRAWNASPLVLCEGDTHTLVPKPLDFRGMPVDLVSRRDLEIRGEIALASGTTRVRFLVWHLTHADLVTPWLDVQVQPRAACTRPR
jgi:uncharacterized lipoprotein YajG